MDQNVREEITKIVNLCRFAEFICLLCIVIEIYFSGVNILTFLLMPLTLLIELIVRKIRRLSQRL